MKTKNSIFDQIFQTKRETREDRKEHSKELLVGLRILQGATISTNNTKFDVFVPFPYKNYVLQNNIGDKISDYSAEEIMNNPNLYPRVDNIHYLQSDESNFEGLFEHFKHKKYKDMYQKWNNLQNKLKTHTKTNHLFFMKTLSSSDFTVGLQKINDNYQKLQKECEQILDDFKESLKPLIKELRGVVIIDGKCQWCP